LADAKVTADNIRWFGEPVYEYDMAQGIEDGYLAACEIHRFDLFLDNKAANERETGVARDDLNGKLVMDADTGELLFPENARPHYGASSFEDALQMPERVHTMCASLFEQLLQTGGPEQKTIIFCARDRHADDVATEMNNLYAKWSAQNNKPRADPYAFKCTAASAGSRYVQELKGSTKRYLIATTVDLLTTGVDVPIVRNIVFFKYVRSPIAFYQMVGRGTRLYPPDGKLMFRVYDYTDATRLFGPLPPTAYVQPKEKKEVFEREHEQVLRVEGFEVHVTDAGRFILTDVDGRAMPVTVEEYKERLAEKLVEEAPTLEEFKRLWVDPVRRREMIANLPDAGRSPFLIRDLEEMNDFDLYDVLAELAYGLAPKTREDRAFAFSYKHGQWLGQLPTATSEVIKALMRQFARAGTEGLENPEVFMTPEVRTAGGVAALKLYGKPADVLTETKVRMFAA